MTKWEDTVMRYEEAISMFEAGRKAEREFILQNTDRDERARQEGRREVVEFIIKEIFPLLNMASVPVSFKNKWNVKLKEWGLE